MREGLESDDRREQVHQALAGEPSLRQAAAQGLVAVDAAAAVLDRLRRAAHDDAQVARFALEGVVVHGEDLLVVVLACDGVGDLVEVDQLVDEHEQPLVAGAPQEAREQLEVVVPVVVGDDHVDAELGARFGLGAVLAAQPLGDVGLGLLVPLAPGAVVKREQLGEVVAVDHLLEFAHDGVDAGFDLAVERGIVLVRAARRHVRAQVGEPAVEDERERAALGARLGREVADELAVGGQPLSPRALQPPFGRQVGVAHGEPVAHRVVADRLEQEALAAAVASHQEPERRASVGDEVQVVQERLDLARAPDGDVGQPDARHHAALQRVDDDGRHAAGDLGLRGAGRVGCRFCRAGGCGVVHAATIPLTSSM